MRLGTRIGAAAWVLAWTAGAARAAAEDAAAQNPFALNDPAIYQESLGALTILFVLAVLLENAFALIFNWRVFLAYFSTRGVRTIIMVGAALILVLTLNLDIVANLIAAYKTPGTGEATPVSSPVTTFVTALILAGGSTGVHNIMYALGYRSERREAEVEARPPKNQAWLAVRTTRRRADGEIFVRIREIGPPDAAAPAPIAGVIPTRRQSVRGLIFRDFRRFPQNGGYALKPNVLYAITVEGRDRDGGRIAPYDAVPFVLADGAIVDLEATL